jgi:hypothetical protein
MKRFKYYYKFPVFRPPMSCLASGVRPTLLDRTLERARSHAAMARRAGLIQRPGGGLFLLFRNLRSLFAARVEDTSSRARSMGAFVLAWAGAPHLTACCQQSSPWRHCAFASVRSASSLRSLGGWT